MYKNNIIFQRGKVWSNLDNYSIAIDGSYSGPLIDNENKIYSFDHHDKCIRHCTKATCVQVMEAVLLGFNPENYNIYINDLDADTLVSASILMYPEIIKNSELRLFIQNLGNLDALGISYPLDKKFWKQFNSFMKYTLNEFDKSNKAKISEDEIKEFLFSGIEKFKNWIENGLPLTDEQVSEKEFEITPITNNKAWIMVKSSEYVFGNIYNSGYDVAVCWDLLDNNSYNYTIGKKSEFVNFPVKDILNHLNEIEKGWGGGTTIGGAPRNQDGTRSFITPENLIKIINKFLKDKG